MNENGAVAFTEGKGLFDAVANGVNIVGDVALEGLEGVGCCQFSIDE